MNELQVDKSNGNVKYNDEKHLYWDNEGKYTSVTTLIDKYVPPFDGDFWSGYKALEKLLPSDVFKIESKVLRDTHKINLNYFLDNYDFTENDFNRTKQAILDEWAETNRQSTVRGSAIHANLEASMLKSCGLDIKKFGFGGKFVCNTNASLEKQNIDLDSVERGVFPEFLIYRKSPNGKLRISGQIDLLIKDGDDIYIFDYKTNKEIKEKSYYDTKTRKNQMMKYPLNNLMDCNKIHYTLQLSTYAWMVKKINPKYNIKKLMLIHYDHKGGVTEYVLDYLEKDVERMLKDFVKQQELEALKAARQPIIF